MADREVEICNCDKVIKKYHKVLEEADKLYIIGENILDIKSTHEITELIRSIKSTLEAFEIAEMLSEKADCKLKESRCEKYTKKDKCEYILKKKSEAFEVEVKYLNEVLELLEKVLCKLELSKDAREEVYRFKKEYFECIHDIYK